MPFLSPFFYIRGFRHLAHFVETPDGMLHAEVSRGQNVWAFQGEHEEHMDGPDADALHGGQRFDDLVVGHFVEGQEIDFSAAGAFRQIAYVGGFLSRKTESTHFVWRKP